MVATANDDDKVRVYYGNDDDDTLRVLTC